MGGTYTIWATFDGTTDYAASRSAPITQVVRSSTSIMYLMLIKRPQAHPDMYDVDVSMKLMSRM